MSERGLNTVSFAGHAASSAQFKVLYAEGMGLVEETASYLDGPGRAASKVLPRMASVLYAAESMRLTTRLMQMASWLLLQRAVNEGEMTFEQAGTEKAKVRLRGFGTLTEGPNWQDLPVRLRELIEHSVRLQERVIRLDDAMYNAANAEEPAENPVSRQLGQLARAFGSGGE